MFRITEDPSSGSLVQCLAKNYKNYSIVSVDMDKVGVMAAYYDPLCVCSSVYMKALSFQLHSAILIPVLALIGSWTLYFREFVSLEDSQYLWK